jgi:hypothetical protein
MLPLRVEAVSQQEHFKSGKAQYRQRPSCQRPPQLSFPSRYPFSFRADCFVLAFLVLAMRPPRLVTLITKYKTLRSGFIAPYWNLSGPGQLDMVESYWQPNVYPPKTKTYNRRDSQMVTHSSTSRPVQCLCMAERTGCPVFTDLWSYVLVLPCAAPTYLHSVDHANVGYTHLSIHSLQQIRSKSVIR